MSIIGVSVIEGLFYKECVLQGFLLKGVSIIGTSIIEEFIIGISIKGCML